MGNSLFFFLIHLENKENDREKRKQGRKRDIERKGEIRYIYIYIEREGGERDRESERESKILVKSSKPRNKAQTKIDYTKLSLEIITQNYRYYIM